jgi:hypothetical protein
MNRTLPTLLLALVSTAAFAQIPTLTSTTNPIIGDTHKVYNTDTFNVGSGAHQRRGISVRLQYTAQTPLIIPHVQQVPIAALSREPRYGTILQEQQVIFFLILHLRNSP